VSLAWEAVGPESADSCFLLLHGILGNRRNWLSFAKRIVEASPGWRGIVADLRNHGDSHGLAGPHTVDACACDVGELAAEIGAEPRVVMGHSFSGKVSLVYARDVAASLRDVWVLDASPGPRSVEMDAGRGTVEHVFQTLREVPVPIAGRSELIEDLKRRGLATSVARWMTTNLVREGDGFRWKFDLEAAEEMLRSYAATDAWGVLESPPSGVRVHVVRASESDRWTEADIARLERLRAAGAVDYVVQEGVSHWLHTQDPEGLFEIVRGTFS
jgi:pimeloyl-ACP methyl ester carboxylesterase